MAVREYRDFDLLVEAEDEGFTARVTRCPSDVSPSVHFRLPFDGDRLENLLLKLDPGRSGVRRSGPGSAAQAALDFGGPLFESVFADEVLLAWHSSLNMVRAAGDGLRLRLRLREAPELAGLPWELLYDGRSGSFLAQSDRTPVVRYLDIPDPPRPVVVDGPLRVLFVISSPSDVPRLDVDGEWDRVQSALDSRVRAGTVVLDRIPATMSDLATHLRRAQVHILHFIGHGEYDVHAGDGVLLFCDRDGRAVRVSDAVLGPHVRDHDPLRLVVLNACHSARGDALDPFGGMAQGLVRQDATAVVAMQFPISDRASIEFTGEFYGALADRMPIDQAVTCARKAMLAEHPTEWATPVLFLRSPDGRIFAGESPAGPATPATPETQPAPGPDAAKPALAAPEAPPTPEPEPEQGPEQGRGNPDSAPGRAGPPIRAPHSGPQAGAGTGAATEPLPQVARPVPRGEATALGRTAPLPLTYAPAPLAGLPQPAVTPPDARDPVGAATGRGTRMSGPTILVGLVVLAVIAVAAFWFLGGSGGQERTTEVEAEAVASPPRIDGLDNDWSGRTSYLADRVVAPDGTSSEVSGSWRLGWDANAFYVFVRVADPVHTQTHQARPELLFRGDSVSFEMGPEQSANAGGLDARDVHLMLGPDEGGRVVAGINVSNGSVFVTGGAATGTRAVSRIGSEGYVVEAAIPWSVLRVANPRVGLVLAGNLNVSDAVAGGTRRGGLQAMVSNNPERAGNSADFREVWGTITLEAAP